MYTGKGQTVLIIDDEDTFTNFLKRALEKYNYNVLTANDGEKGLILYKKQYQTIDLVLLDLTLPNISGQKVLKVIIETNPLAKVVLSTGGSYNEIKHLHLAKGVLIKPFKLTLLLDKIKKVLDT